MKKIIKFLTFLITLTFSPLLLSAESSKVLHLEGKEGPGKDKTIVLVSGDEEYRTEESMPMLAKILSEKHGFTCKVLFSWDKTGKYIDPNNQQGVIGWEHLKDADLMLIGTRFRKPNAEDAEHITNFLNSGKPVVGIRTSTHAFNGGEKFGDKISFGQFGPLIMGEGWVSHHGRHKVEGARGMIETKNAAHPILKGVTDVFGPSDVYGVKRLTEKDTILLRGAVTENLEPSSSFVDSKNDPMQPLAWLHPYEAPNGKKGTTFCTTMGASVDLVSEDLRRMLVNSVYFLTGLKVPENADVSYVDPFYPSFYGFIKDKEFWPGQDMQAEDYGLGKSPNAPDPKGTPEWSFRPTKGG
jgi:type 1 glutamine amidotransferase